VQSTFPFLKADEAIKARAASGGVMGITAILSGTFPRLLASTWGG